jgi:putative DNA primase/helicase
MKSEADREARTIISDYRATHRDSVVAEPLPMDLTEDALALEFTRRHRDALRYVHEWGKWLRWDGTRWAFERTLAVFDLARDLVREIGIGVLKERQRSRLQANATVAAIVSLARVDRAHARVTEDFDADPWLLNTPAGTIDLRCGETRPHDRDDGITKVTPVAPADSPADSLWTDCLNVWTRGDHELRAFLHRLCGYFLTGITREEVLPIVHGPGANGKTKFIETVRDCLGPDYATGVAMETLIITSGEQHPTDVADLRSKRLAIAVETEEGRRLAESKVKQLTGGDRLRARYMRRDFFEFEPTHKLVIVGNHRPALRNVDEAMRRRLLLIPFEARIPPEKRDRELAEKLEGARPAILRWMVAGCLAWRRDGLLPPECVRAATDHYFETADAFGRWVEECLVFDANASMSKSEAFTSWKNWAETNGEFVGGQQRLNEMIARLPKVDEVRLTSRRVRSWLHVGLKQAE